MVETKEAVIKLNEVVCKTSKAGRKYHIVNGNFSCFDLSTVEELNKHIGKNIKLSYVENEQGFKNIKQFLGETDATQAVSQPAVVEDKADKLKSIYLSYAKDLFIHLQPMGNCDNSAATMVLAVQLVKQAIALL